MNDLIKAEEVQHHIYRIRGQRVMVDSELASLYGVATKRLNEQVKRNNLRFPYDFMFQLTHAEANFLRSQNAASKTGRGGRRYRPLVFTEQGVAMLSTVLNSERAIQVNIAIMRAFVRLRHTFFQSKDLAIKVEKLEGRINVHDTDIRLLVQDVHDLKKRLHPIDPISPTII